MRIVLDAGHGGYDPGAVGFGIEEEDITLALVLQIGQLLQQYKGVEIKYTRTDDTFIELSKRADIANDWGADYFISCHVNSGGNGTANGFESFIYTEPSQKSVTYQNIIHSEIVKSIKVNDRGKKRKNLAVLRETNCPAILTETLFINSASDNRKLKDSAFIRAAAAGHALGVAAAFGLQLKERHPVSKPVPTIEKEEPKMKRADAEKVITYLQAAWKTAPTDAEKKEIGRLADEVRVAGGMKKVNQ